MWLSRYYIMVYVDMFSSDINTHDTILQILYDLTYLTTGCVCRACVIGKRKNLSLYDRSIMAVNCIVLDMKFDFHRDRFLLTH